MLFSISHAEDAYDKVTLGSTTPSKFPFLPLGAKDKKRELVPLYRHWFALELYDVFHTLELDNPINGSEISVPRHSLDRFVSKLTTIYNPIRVPDCDGYMRQPGLHDRELFYSPQLAREFDRFLFRDENDKGACYHQLSSRGQERPDLYVLQMKNATPVMPVLVSDFKCTEMEHAKDETVAYAISSLEVCTDRCAVVLGLPATRYDMSLLVCIGYHGKMLVMEVCTVNVCNEDSMKKFLSTVYYAVYRLLNNTIVTEGSRAIHTICEFRHQALSGSTRVVKCNSGVVHKYYDTEYFEKCSPQVDIINSLNALRNASVRNLSFDGRFQQLDYKYIDGSHEPANSRQVAMIISILHTIHEKNYVHSDIRKQNIVFCSDRQTAYIIDFDLIGEVGTDYPAGYNHYTGERHSDARCHQPRKQEHDRYSLHFVLMRTRWYKLKATQEEKDVLEKLNTMENLSDISKELKP